MGVTPPLQLAVCYSAEKTKSKNCLAKFCTKLSFEYKKA